MAILKNDHKLHSLGFAQEESEMLNYILQERKKKEIQEEQNRKRKEMVRHGLLGLIPEYRRLYA